MYIEKNMIENNIEISLVFLSRTNYRTKEQHAKSCDHVVCPLSTNVQLELITN